MARRQAVQTTITQPDGTRITMSVLDGLLPEDLVILGMKCEGYRLLTTRDAWSAPSKAIKDYLVRTDTVQEF